MHARDNLECKIVVVNIKNSPNKRLRPNCLRTTLIGYVLFSFENPFLLFKKKKNVPMTLLVDFQ